MRKTIPLAHLTLALAGGVLCILLTGCTSTSKDGSLAVIGVGYESRGESKVEVSDKVAQAVSDAAKALSVGTQASELVSGVAKTVADVSKSADTAKITADTAKTAAESAKTTADINTTKVGNLVTDTAVITAKLTVAEEALKRLDNDTQAKLKQITADQITGLKDLKSDPAAFNTQLNKVLEERGLNTAQIEDFKKKTSGFSTEQILGLLAAAGAGGVIGKTGKSRAQPEIDKLKEKVTKIEAKNHIS